MILIGAKVRSALEEVPRVLLDEAHARLLDDTIDAAAELDALVAEPSLVVVVGGSGSGKSTITNAIIGSDVAPVSPIRPTTTNITAIGASPPFPVEGATEYVIVAGLPAGLIVVDTPPWDAATDIITNLVEASAVTIVVVTPSRYGDESTREAVEAVRRSNSALVIVANRMPDDDVSREQLEDAIGERLGELPQVVVKEGGIAHFPRLILDPIISEDTTADARRRLAEQVSEASRRLARFLTASASDVGALSHAIDATVVPLVGPTGSWAGSTWTETAEDLVEAAMGAVDQFDEAVVDAGSTDLADRVRDHLPAVDRDELMVALMSWKQETSRRVRDAARLRFRLGKRAALDLIERDSWLLASSEDAAAPRRMKRLLGREYERTTEAVRSELADLLQTPASTRQQQWGAVVDAAGEYRPGMLFAAASAGGGTTGA